MSKTLDHEFFAQDTLTVAKALLGANIKYRGCCGRIVETEAYRDDAASHAITRPQAGKMLWSTFGRIYIYRIYGVHYCLNFTTEKDGAGAVLIRALEPVAGIEAMMLRRKTNHLHELTNGPAKLFQALDFDPALHGQEIEGFIQLTFPDQQRAIEIGTGTRIGISKATDLEWRFFLKGNRFVSRGR